MNTQLAIRKEITPTVLDMAIKLGEVAFKSGICKAPSPAAATAMMLKGYELGFGLMGSFEMVQVIQGNVGLSPKGAMAIMRAHPEIIEDIKINQMYDPSGKYIGCECTIKRKGYDPHTEKFTMEDAKTAGLLKADSGWSKYPENMCKWRATGFCADVVCPDLTGGLTRFLIEPEIYTGTEISEEDPEISNLVIDVPSTPIAIEAPEETITLSDLTSKFTPDQIMAANEGKIPATNEECARIYEKLNTSAA